MKSFLIFLFLVLLISAPAFAISSNILGHDQTVIPVSEKLFNNFSSRYIYNLYGECVPYDAFAIFKDNYYYIVFSDMQNNRILLVKIDNSPIITNKPNNFLFKVIQSVTNSTDVFNKPKGVVLDGNGNIYICDSGNNRLLKFEYDDNLNCTFVWQSNSGLANPSGIGITADGNFIWVASTDNDQIVKFDSAGVFKDSKGSSGSGIGQFLQPSDVDIIDTDELLIADNGNLRLVCWNITSSAWHERTFNRDSKLCTITHIGNEIFIADQGMEMIFKYKNTNFFLAAQAMRNAICINAIPGTQDHLLCLRGTKSAWEMKIVVPRLYIDHIAANSIANKESSYQYLLSRTSKITERIINSNGSEVKMLKDNITTDFGSVKGTWDLTNNSGKRVKNGLYQIEVTCGDMVLTNEINVYGFKGEGYLSVKNPNKYEQLIPGTTYTIRWFTKDMKVTDKIKIEYSFNNGVNWNIITKSTANTGSYNWKVPNTPSDNCLVRISEALAGYSADVSDTKFRIYDFYLNGLILECEDMSLSNLKKLEYNGANMGAVVTFEYDSSPGSVSHYTQFETNTYRINARYVDTADGACKAEFYNNKVLLHSWVWDDVTSGAEFIDYNLGSFYIAEKDIFRIKIMPDGLEKGMLDCITLYRQTNNYVKGSITSDVTWTKEHSPYIISGDVTVASGASLTIESGVDVVFMDTDSLAKGNDPQKCELIVDGSINIGDVIFQGFASDSCGAWLDIKSNWILNSNSKLACCPFSRISVHGKLLLQDTTRLTLEKDSILEVSDSTIIKNNSKLDVKQSKVHFNMGCYVEKTAILNLDDSNVEFAPNASMAIAGQIIAEVTSFKCNESGYWQGIRLEGTSKQNSKISHCNITDCIDGITIVHSQPLIEECKIYNIKKNGINISSSGTTPIVSFNSIYSCGGYPIQISNGAFPSVCDNKIQANDCAAVFIWNADGIFGGNDFRSNAEGIYVFGSTSNTYFYASSNSEYGGTGNKFDLANISSDGVVIDGGMHNFGQVSLPPIHNGQNVFRNRGNDYYIRNNTPTLFFAEDNSWPDGTGGAFTGQIDFTPTQEEQLDKDILKQHYKSPVQQAFYKYFNADYTIAIKELEIVLQNSLSAPNADYILFLIAKSALQLDSLDAFEPYFNNLYQTSSPEIQYQAQLWLTYLYAARGEMKKAEEIAFQSPAGSPAERELLLALASYYYSNGDGLSAMRIADILRERHKDSGIDKAINAICAFKIEFK